MEVHYQRLRVRGVRGALLCLAAASGLAVALAAHGAEPGVWQSHQMIFNYLGAEPTYSCDGLSHILQALLKQAGARLDGPISAGPCSGGAGTPSKMLFARFKFSTLQPASASGSDAASVPGEWKQVRFAPQHPLNVLSGGDCELDEEFKGKVLTMFATRNMKANLQCIPFQTTGYFFNLSFEVFVPSDAGAAAGSH